MDTGPRAPVLNIIREEVRREGETLCLLTSHPSTTDSEIREGGTQGLQRDTTSTLNTTHHTERVTQGRGIDMTFHAQRLEA